MEFLNEYLVLVIVGICLCIGYIIKNIIPSDKINKYIPAIMGLIGLFLNVWMSGWKVTPAIILGGLFSGLASTGLYEAFRTFLENLKNVFNKKE